jgi:hypothetical protein
MKRARRPTCRRDRASWFTRALNFLRSRSPIGRCGDFFVDEPPPDIGVREPRRPRPSAPGGTALLELPPSDLGMPESNLGWN